MSSSQPSTTSPTAPLETAADVARRLRVTPRTVRRWVRNGSLPALRIGGVVRFDPRALEEFLEARRVGDQAQRDIDAEVEQ